MESGRILDSYITASSYYGNRVDHAPFRARLNTRGNFTIAYNSKFEKIKQKQITHKGGITTTCMKTKTKLDKRQQKLQMFLVYPQPTGLFMTVSFNRKKFHNAVKDTIKRFNKYDLVLNSTYKY